MEIQKDLTVKGMSTIQEKTNQMRLTFSKAVALDLRCGTGKLVFEHYERQVSIWGASANIEPLSFGISSGELDDEDQEFTADLDVQDGNNNEHVGNEQDESDSEPDVDTGNSLQASRPTKTGKGKVGSSIVSKLVGIKRKHLERNLTAVERDQLFIKEIKSDPEFRKDLLQLV